MISSYKDLIVWQKAISLVVEIYKLTENFPLEEVMKMLNVIIRKFNPNEAKS